MQYILEFEVNTPDKLGVDSEHLGLMLSDIIKNINKQVAEPGFDIRRTPSLFFYLSKGYRTTEDLLADGDKETAREVFLKIAASAIILAASTTHALTSV